MAPSNVSVSSSTTFKSPAPTIRRIDNIPSVDLSQDARPFDLTIYDMSDGCSNDGSVRMILQSRKQDLAVNGVCSCLDVCDCGELLHHGYAISAGDELSVTCPVYDMAASDADGLWSFPDCTDLSHGVDLQQADVRMIESDASFEIILDSGADISVLPIGWEMCGQPRELASMKFRDAQGNPISMSACREAMVSLGNSVFRETFAVGPVTAPLIALGKLIKAGWNLQQGSSGLVLAKGSDQIAVHYRRNSLCTMGHIRAVSQDEVASSIAPSASNAELDMEAVHRVELSDVLQNVGAGWKEVFPDCFALKCTSDVYLDITSCLPEAGCKYRTTIILDNGVWELVEFGQDIAELANQAGPIPAIEGPVEVLTLAHRYRRKPGQLGFEAIFYDEEPPAVASGSKPDEIPQEVQIEQKQQHEFSALSPEVAEAQHDRPHPEVADSVTVDGEKLTAESTVKALREACGKCSIGQSGGKAVLFNRLARHVQALDSLQAQQLAKRLREDDSRKPNQVAPVSEPTPEQRREHAVTHLPYEPWCKYCVAHKARSDKHHKATGLSRGTSGISMDFSFTGRDEGSAEKLTVLNLCDRDTKLVDAIPVTNKGGVASVNYMVAEICRFSNLLGHGDISLRSDGEPAMQHLQNKVQEARLKMNLKTKPELTETGDHKSNGRAEQTCQAIRQMAGILLEDYEDKVKTHVATGHPLHSWSFRHAAWLLNRFNPQQGMTPFERLNQSAYTGKVVCFGETVMARVKTATKGRPAWVKSLWLGKLAISDMRIVCTSGGHLILTRCVRRLPESERWDASMHGCLREYSWDHPGLTAGHCAYTKRARSAVQVDQQFHFPVLEDGAPLASLLPTAQVVESGVADDEAASDPPTSPAEDLPREDSITPTEMPSPEVVADAAMGDEAGANLGDRPAVAQEEERPAKQAKLEPPKKQKVAHGSASSQGLASAPSFAGSIKSVEFSMEHDNMPHMDEPLECSFTEEDADLFEQYWDYGFDEQFVDEWEQLFSPEEIPDALDERSKNSFQRADASVLYFPGTDKEPQLDEQRLADLDEIAEMVEVQRLTDMGVLRQVKDTEHGQLQSSHRSLNTRFVHTWRFKRVNGEGKWLRTRLVAKEFKHLDKERMGLFAPSSSAIMCRVVQSLYTHHRQSKGWIMCSFDVHDAYLTVDQKKPTVISTTLSGETIVHELLKCVPGQRDGAVLWFDSFSNHLKEVANVQACPEVPAFFRINALDGSSNFMIMLVHVDDCLLAGTPKDVNDLITTLKAKFQLTVEYLRRPGDEISFLKRRHLLLEDYTLIIQSPLKHFQHLVELVGLNVDVFRPRKTPMPVGVNYVEQDKTLLEAESASAYRSAVGLLLYLSPDVVESQRCIRVLSQFMSAPTQGSFKLLKHLVSYLWGARGHAIGFSTPVSGKGIVSESSKPYLLEAISDADWSGDRESRRSSSSGNILLNGQLLYSSSRVQKAVALSSGESEFYASVSTASDALMLKAMVSFAIGSNDDVELKLIGDSAAARGIQSRRGSGKVRHLSGKYLWLHA